MKKMHGYRVLNTISEIWCNCCER